jgi:hypothetical protein
MSTASVASSQRPAPAYAAYPQLARLLWQWLAVGVLLLLVFPVARGQSHWFGPGAFWLLGAPLTSLLVFYRHAVATAWRGILVPAPGRRLPRGQGRRLRRPGFGSQPVRSRQRAA